MVRPQFAAIPLYKQLTFKYVQIIREGQVRDEWYHPDLCANLLHRIGGRRLTLVKYVKGQTYA